MRTETSLNGTWRIYWDEDRGGADYEKTRDEGVDIVVPSVWEEIRPEYDGVAWYAREFEVADIADRAVRLRFDAVNYKADVYVNGAHAGTHEGGYTPFTIDATEHVKPGRNELLVRVLDVGKERIEGLVLGETPSAKEGGQGNFGGIWQDVALLVHGRTYVANCFVIPKIRENEIVVWYDVVSDVARRIQLRALCASHGAGDVAFERSKDFDVAAGTTRLEWKIDWSEYAPWSLEEPKLYDLSTTVVADGAECDVVTERFGMREFTVENNRFHLNGKEIYLKGLLHQGPYPITIAYPHDEEFARREIELAKEANCNIIRLHLKPAPRITQRLADEMGMLLYAEPPIGWLVDTPDLPDLCRREIKELIERDFNHPSVVIWGMLNETGNPGFAKVGGCQEIRDELCHYARGLDPSRLVIDDSGSYEFTGRSGMVLPWEDELVPTQDRHGYYRSPMSKKDYERIKNLGAPGTMLFRSEYGTGGMPIFPDVVSAYEEKRPGFEPTMRRQFEKTLADLKDGFARNKLREMFPGVSAFCDASQNVQADGVLLESQAMRLNPSIAGYIICQFADYPGESGGGLVDMWRRPKKAFHTFGQVNRPLQATLMAEPVCYWPGSRITYEMSVVNEGDAIPGCALKVSLEDPWGAAAFVTEIAMDVAHGVASVAPPEITIGYPGGYTLSAEILRDGTSLSVTRIPVTSLARPQLAEGAKVHVIDATGRLGEFLTRSGVDVIPFTDGEEASLILVGDLEELDVSVYERLLAAYACAARGALVAYLAIGNAKPMSPWYKTLTFDFYPEFFPEEIHLLCAEGRVENVFHYVKEHPLFTGLPQNTVANQEYRNVYPNNCLVDARADGEVLAGCFHMHPTRWGVDVMLMHHGAGGILIDQFNIIPNLGSDPVAEIMLFNCMAFGARYELTGEAESDGDRKAREERVAAFGAYLEAGARDWLVVGPFDNRGENEAMSRVLDPEKRIDVGAAYDVAAGRASWQKYTTTKSDAYLMDLGARYAREKSVCYAVTFFKSTVHKMARLVVESRNVRVWHNNTEVIRENAMRELVEFSAEIDIRRGWNKILIKSADYSYDGTVNNHVTFKLRTQDGAREFPDLVFSVDDVAAAEKEINELFLPPYLAGG